MIQVKTWARTRASRELDIAVEGERHGTIIKVGRETHKEISEAVRATDKVPAEGNERDQESYARYERYRGAKEKLIPRDGRAVIDGDLKYGVATICRERQRSTAFIWRTNLTYPDKNRGGSWSSSKNIGCEEDKCKQESRV